MFPRYLHDSVPLQSLVALEELVLYGESCDVDSSAQAQQELDHTSPSHLPPTLRTISLRVTSFDVRRFAPLPPLRCLDLWQLLGDARLMPETCLELLMGLPTLEICKLDINIAGGPDPVISEAVSLPYLRSLFITWDVGVDVGLILDNISTPHLTTLDLNGPPPGTPSWNHLFLFLQRCRPPLTELAVSAIELTDIQLLDCLRSCPCLRSFSLCYCYLGPGFLKELTLNHGATDGAEIVPSLKSMTLEACYDLDILDLVDMLRSRGRNSLEGERTLESVKLYYCESIQELDKPLLENCGIDHILIHPWTLPVS